MTTFRACHQEKILKSSLSGQVCVLVDGAGGGRMLGWECNCVCVTVEKTLVSSVFTQESKVNPQEPATHRLNMELDLQS
jgi:hypothetical protein